MNNITLHEAVKGVYQIGAIGVTTAWYIAGDAVRTVSQLPPVNSCLQRAASKIPAWLPPHYELLCSTAAGILGSSPYENYVATQLTYRFYQSLSETAASLTRHYNESKKTDGDAPADPSSLPSSQWTRGDTGRLAARIAALYVTYRVCSGVLQFFTWK